MRFVDVPTMVTWVSEQGAQNIIAGMIEQMERDFLRWEKFDKRPRDASHSPIGVIELMPTSDGETYAFKYVNGHPSNPARGYQTITAFGVLAGVDTGYPMLLAEMTLLTALRTAAISALGTKTFARQDAHHLALIGAGGQSEFQTLATMAVRDIDTVTAYDVDPAASEKLKRNLAAIGINVQIADSAQAAVCDADVIITCTADKRDAVVLQDEWVAPGVHINAIGGDCPGKTELDPAILHRGPVFVEFEPQTRIEGEIQHQDPAFPVTEMWTVMNGQAAGRTSDDQVTIFDAVGFAIEDFSALVYLDRAVRGTEYVKEIDLIADPSDPKDLFGMVTPALQAV